MVSVTLYTINPTVAGIFYVLFAIGGSCTNFGVLATILRDPNLRKSGMHFPILLLTLVDILISVFMCPVNAYGLLNLTSTLCEVNITLAYMFYIFTAITMYGMILLYVNHIAHIRNPNETRQNQWGIVGTIFVCVACIVSLVPSVNAFITRVSLGSSCTFTFPRSTQIDLYVGTYFVPLGILCLLGIIMITLHSTTRPSLQNTIGSQPQTPVRFPSHLIVAGFIVCFTAGPNFIIGLIQFNGYVGSWYITLTYVFSMLNTSKCFLLPFAWMLDPQYNNSVRAMFGRPTNTVMSPPVVYNNYQPNVMDIYPQRGYVTSYNGPGYNQNTDIHQQKS